MIRQCGVHLIPPLLPPGISWTHTVFPEHTRVSESHGSAAELPSFSMGSLVFSSRRPKNYLAPIILHHKTQWTPPPPPPQLPTPVRSAWPSAENQIYIYILKCGSVGNENDFSVSVFHTKNSRLALAAEAFKPNKPKPTFVIPVPAVQPEEMRPAHLDSAELETFSQTTGGDM